MIDDCSRAASLMFLPPSDVLVSTCVKTFFHTTPFGRREMDMQHGATKVSF